MKDLAAEGSTGSSNDHETERRTEILEPSVWLILYGMLDTGAKKNFATLALVQKECNPQWLLNIMWMDEANFSLHADMNTQNSSIWTTSNPCEYHSQPLHLPHVNVSCGFIASFILGSFFFWRTLSCIFRKTCTVTAEQYLMLLRDHVVSWLQERYALFVVTFMQDGAPPHIAHDIKTFLLESFTEDWVISPDCKFQWPTRLPDLNPAYFWLWR